MVLFAYLTNGILFYPIKNEIGGDSSRDLTYYIHNIYIYIHMIDRYIYIYMIYTYGYLRAQCTALRSNLNDLASCPKNLCQEPGRTSFWISSRYFSFKSTMEPPYPGFKQPLAVFLFKLVASCFVCR